ncbi:MAG: BatA domain-containing protein [Tepidisphaeraceae bacterium]
MSFLTPLYIAGVLAVALPVLFHLLKRSPQKQQTFSSLMFLAPTPPRFARRSRISNWLLLLLRAAALVLLALAFARPFFRSDAAIAAGGQGGRFVGVLVDVSASMRREDLWQQAQRHANAVLDSLGPQDHAALFFFDRTLRQAVSFEQWQRLDAAQRLAAFRGELEKASPTWESTSLGDAVAQAAEIVAAAGQARTESASQPGTVVLISDLQQGGHADALQGHAWPESVRLDVRPVTAKSKTNAAVQLIIPQADASDAADDRPCVRVSNNAGGEVDRFTVSWANANGVIASVPPQPVDVPAGASRVVRFDWPPANLSADRLVLNGDDSDFDNTLYVVPPRKAVARVRFAGDDAVDDPEGLAFYLRTALGDTPRKQVDFVAGIKEPLVGEKLNGADLLVIGRPLGADSATAVNAFAASGENVLWVLRSAADIAGLESTIGTSGLQASESNRPTFSLISRLDTTHPLLAPFADARFGDFSRIHFWKHRVLSFTGQTRPKVLAAFDNGDAFLSEFTVGRGRVFVMTSGWQPGDSQLALSSKFLPILDGLIRPRGNELARTQYVVGGTISVPESPSGFTLRKPDGSTVRPSDTAGLLDVPGKYAVEIDGKSAEIVVNLRPDESRTMPLSAADFAQWGAKLASAADPVAAAEQQAPCTAGGARK